MLALFRFLRLSLLGFRYRLPLLPDQGCQGLTDWKLVSDGLDNVLQFIFATSKGTFFEARRNGEIERRIPDRVPWEALFQTPIFVDRQNEKVVANPVSHSHHRVNRKPGEKQPAALRLSANRTECRVPTVEGKRTATSALCVPCSLRRAFSLDTLFCHSTLSLIPPRLFPAHLLPHEPRGYLPESELQVFGIGAPERVEKASDQTRPPRLVAGAMVAPSS